MDIGLGHKHQLFLNKLINPPTLTHFTERQRMMGLFAKFDNFHIARNSIVGASVYPSATSWFMKKDLVKGISGIMDTYKNAHDLIGTSLINSKAFELASTKNLQGVYGIAAGLHNLSEMTKGIQGLIGNTNLLTNSIGLRSMMSENVITKDKYYGLFSTLNNFAHNNSFASLFQEIDWGGLEDIDIDHLSQEAEETNIRNESSSELSATVKVRQPKKTSSELTVEDLKEILKKSVTPTAGILSLSSLFWNVFNDYVKDVAFLIMEVLLALMISFTVGSYNAEVKELIEERIVESKTVRDVRKVTKKYLDIPPVIGLQIAFLRTDAVLREGRSNTAPAIEKVTEQTVLFIVDRKGNWLQVEVETENDYFVGWVQESKVNKFKKIE